MGAVSDTAGRSEEGKLNAQCVSTHAPMCPRMNVRVSVCACVCVSLKGWMHATGESNTMSEC